VIKGSDPQLLTISHILYPLGYQADFDVASRAEV